MIEVTLLGTGSPMVDALRAGPSTLVRAGEQLFLVDCGRGVCGGRCGRRWRRRPDGPAADASIAITSPTSATSSRQGGSLRLCARRCRSIGPRGPLP